MATKGRDANGRILPGTVLNPNGRPRTAKSMTELLRAKLDEPCPRDKAGRTWREALVEATLKAALRNPFDRQHLWERVEGKVVQNVGVDDSTKALLTAIARALGGQ